MSYIIDDYYDVEGNLVHWDDEARQVVVTAPDGTVISSRPYTPDEVTILEQSVAARSVHDNGETLKELIRAEIALIRTEIDELNALIDTTNATINSNPASYIKGLARAQRAMARRVLALVKIVGGDLADTTL